MNHTHDIADAQHQGAPAFQSWPSPGRAWWGVILLMLAYAFSYIDRTVLALVVQPVKQSLDLTDTQIGLLQGPAFGVFFTLSTIPMGWLADAMSRTRLVAIGIAFWSAMTWACGLSASFGQLFLARMGVALGESTLSPAAPSLLADSFPPERRTLPMNLYVVAGGAGTALALMAGGFVAAIVHSEDRVVLPLLGAFAPWQVICFTVSTPGLIVGVMFLLTREPTRRDRGQTEANLAELWRVFLSRGPILIPQTAGIGLFQLQAFAIGAWLPTFFMRVHHWSMADVGLIWGATMLVSGPLGGIAAGWVARVLWRRGMRDANLRTSALFLAAMAPPAIAGVLVSNVWLSVALMGLMTLFAHGPSGGSLATIQEIVPNRLRGRFTAFYYAVLGLLSMTVGPLIIGLMNDHFFVGASGIGTSLAIVSILALPTGAALLLLAGRRRCALDWVE